MTDEGFDCSDWNPTFHHCGYEREIDSFGIYQFPNIPLQPATPEDLDAELLRLRAKVGLAMRL